MGAKTLGSFPASVYKEDILDTSCFAFLCTKHLKISVILKMSECFLFTGEDFSEVRKTSFNNFLSWKCIVTKFLKMIHLFHGEELFVKMQSSLWQHYGKWIQPKERELFVSKGNTCVFIVYERTLTSHFAPDESSFFRSSPLRRKISLRHKLICLYIETLHIADLLVLHLERNERSKLFTVSCSCNDY